MKVSTQEFDRLLASLSREYGAGDNKKLPFISAVSEFAAFVVSKEHSLSEIAEVYGYSSDTEEDYRYNLKFQSEEQMRKGWLRAHITLATIYSRRTWTRFVAWLKENNVNKRGEAKYDIDMMKINRNCAACSPAMREECNKQPVRECLNELADV